MCVLLVRLQHQAGPRVQREDGHHEEQPDRRLLQPRRVELALWPRVVVCCFFVFGGCLHVLCVICVIVTCCVCVLPRRVEFPVSGDKAHRRDQGQHRSQGPYGLRAACELSTLCSPQRATRFAALGFVIFERCRFL